jgi:predicted HTH domain antitoxin
MTVITEKWALEQLVKLQLTQPELVGRALQKIMEDDENLRWSLVINAYLDEQISLSKAAQLLGLHRLELQERLIELGIPLYIGPADKAEAQAEVDALRTWTATRKQPG